MTAYEKAHGIIADVLDNTDSAVSPKGKAAKILDALMKKRMTVVSMRASTEMFVRFHAHTRWLASQIGETYRDLYNDAIAYAEERGEWPCKVIPRTAVIAGEEITFDVSVPESTTRATTSQLMTAYQHIVEVAAEHRISLPENVLHEIGG